MKFTAATRYAVQALAHMAVLKANPIVVSRIVAQTCGLPEKYLLKVLKPLTTAGLLHSLKGPNGGYRLARPAKSITLLEIVEAVDGPVRGLAPAVGGVPAAAAGLDRHLAELCDAAADATRKQLQKVRLSDLAGPRAR
jgi:Rrf2 family protein